MTAERRATRSRRPASPAPGRRDLDPDEAAPDEERPDEEERPRGGVSRRRGRLTAGKAAAQGWQQIADLTGKQPEGVTGVEPGPEGWVVGVEVVEDRRIPSSSDILAAYEIELDETGEVLAYRRTRRYARGQGDGGRDA